MLRTLIFLLLALASTLAFGERPAAAAAGTGPCVPDRTRPLCTFWNGEVSFVADGDTFDVDIEDDGTSEPVRVRLTGVQAMEQRVYSSYPSRRRGDCHALEATARLEALVASGGGAVRLAAQRRGSASGGRMRRSLAVNVGGTWVDAGLTLLREGHALWLPNSAEYAWNRIYSTEAQRAAASGVNLWDRAYCGAGPAPDARLRVRVRWDAPHEDGRNVNGEWIQVVNGSRESVPLDGWWVRDSHLRRYTFPAGTSLPPRRTVTVRVGRGRRRGLTHYWGLAEPAFENVTGKARGMGDGAYLFDPDGDLRAWSVYPCRYAC